MHDLEKALQDAGVPEYELNAPQQVLNTGLPTFIPVNAATATELRVLRYRSSQPLSMIHASGCQMESPGRDDLGFCRAMV